MKKIVQTNLEQLLCDISIATYIFSPTFTTTIIILQPCALNVEFQHLIPNFSKFSSLCRPHSKKEYGSKEAQTQGDFKENSAS